MDTYRMLFYIVPITLVLAHTSQSERQSLDCCYTFYFLASPSIYNPSMTIQSCIECCKRVGQYAYAGVNIRRARGRECFCGRNAGSDFSSVYYGKYYGIRCTCSCFENRFFSCGEIGLSVFDLLSGPQQTTEKSTSVMTISTNSVLSGPQQTTEKSTSVMTISTNSVLPGPQQTTENSTSVMTISTNSAWQQSTITQHEPTPPFITEKGVMAAVLGTLCGILLIYGVIVSLLLYLSRRTLRSMRNSKEPTAKQKPYTGLDRTNPERHSYQGIYLSPNGERNQCPDSVQTHSYQEIVTPCSSYRNDAVGQVRGRQAAQEARRNAPDEPDDENYVIPEL